MDIKMKSFIFAFLFGAFACGCVSATVTEPRLCDTREIIFPGAPANPGIVIPPVTQSFTLNLGVSGINIPKIELLNGQLTRADGGNLAFLDEIMITIGSPSNGLVLWDSKKNDSTMLTVAAFDKNLSNYTDNNYLTVNITLSSQHPPVDSWALDTALCVSAEATETLP